MILTWDGSDVNALAFIELCCSIIEPCTIDYQRDCKVITINNVNIHPNDTVAIRRKGNNVYIELITPEGEEQ